MAKSTSASTPSLALVPERLLYPIATPVPAIPASFFRNPRSGVLFDMDGTLIESKEIWYFLLDGCSRHLGYGPLPYSVWEPTYGQSVEANRDTFFPRHSQEVVDQYCEQHYHEFVEHLHVLPGAEAALKATREALGGDVSRMAICTNCPVAITNLIVKHCPMLAEFFSPERTICAGNLLQLTPALVASCPELRRLQLTETEQAALTAVKGAATYPYALKAKPSTDIIHAGAHALGVSASQCVFVGDSKFDMISSIDGGCFAVGLGEKGKGGHVHIKNIQALESVMQAKPKLQAKL